MHPSEHDDFTDVYRAARAGDPAAATHLLARQREALVRFLEARAGAAVRRRFEIGDLYQQTVLTLLGRLARFPEDLDEDEFAARVFRTAKWVIADAARFRTRDRGESAMPQTDAVAAPAPTGSVTRADDRRLLDELVASLPEIYREVVERCVIQGRSTAEVAEHLELGRETVKKRLARARRLLAELAGGPGG